MRVAQFQACDTCHEELPLKASHYDRKRDSPTGFRTTCKICRKETRGKEQRHRVTSDANADKLAKLVDDVDSQAISALEAMEIAKKGSRVPHEAEIYEALTEALGGPQGVASKTLIYFLSQNASHRGRFDVLKSYYRMASNVTKAGDATKPLELCTDEEIDTMLQDRMSAFCANNPKLVVELLERQGVNFAALAAERAARLAAAVPIVVEDRRDEDSTADFIEAEVPHAD